MMTDSVLEREKLWSHLGPLPERHRPISAMLVRRTEAEHYVLEELRLDLNGLEAVPAYFVKPKATTGAVPAVLYHHGHWGDYGRGKDELIGSRPGMQGRPYAEELARRGWAVLCIDCWNFGARHGRTESSLFKEMFWKGQVLWGMMVYDAVRALDYLVSRPEVDGGRVGTMGMSMGSTLAWWLAALDERVKVCVDLCCLTDFEALVEEDGLDRHGLYYYAPGILNSFSTAGINALIAPRPHLGVAGKLDPLTPAAGLDRIDGHLREVYGGLGVAEAWRLVRYEVAHEETAEMRAEILRWLERWL